MAIVKSLLILLSVLAMRHASTPPNTPPPTAQLREQRGFEHITPHVPTLGRVLAPIIALLDILVLLALDDHLPPALAHPILAALPSTLTTHPHALTALTPTFLLGASLTLAGALLRAHCFRALGHRFTFELAIRPAHALVTHGVYSVVRHPSYTGGLAIALGSMLHIYDHRQWFVGVCAPVDVYAFPVPDERCHTMVGGALACVIATSLGLFYMIVCKRMDKEDTMLEKHFGEEWRTWAKSVPCRVVLGVC